MKKKGFLVLVIMLLAFTLKTQAATYSNYLPGGKNYINPENFRLRGETIETIESFKVLPNQTYTLTYPGDDMFPVSEVTIGGGSGTTYVYGVANQVSSCTVTEFKTTCTFTTTSNESSLLIRMKSSGTIQFFGYYKVGEIQLEEGTSSTSFSSYIAPAIDTVEPSFTDNGTFTMSYLDQTPIQTIIGNHITVVDEIDGDLSNQIVVETDAYTNNMNKIGTYLVTLSAIDSSGNKALFDLMILVKDEIAPTIVGPSTLAVSVSNAPSVTELIAQNYTITDDYDGALSYNIVSDTYSMNKDKIGTYNVTFETMDSSSNKKSKSVSITLSDNQSPVIEGVSSINSPMSNPLTIEAILATQYVSDNYSDLSINDVTVEDLYTINKENTGIYDITLTVEDASGNQTSKIIKIQVLDDIKPTISGPVTYVDSYTSQLTINDLIALISIADNEDIMSIEDLIIVTDNFTNRSTEIGTFVVSFELSDNAGNKATHAIEITLVDDMAPVIYVDSYIVTVNANTIFSQNDAYRLLLSSNELEAGEYEIKTLYDEYEGHEGEAGSYLYKLSFTSKEGKVIEKEFVIKVADEPSIFEEYLTIRNIVLYGASLMLLVLTIYKAKK